MRTFYLPPKTKSLAGNYLSLKIGPHKVRCPYFQNITHRRTTPVLGGKGLPEEIEKEALKLFNQRKKPLTKFSPNKVRTYMVIGGLGVDCSGLVTNLLNSFLLEKKLGPLWKQIKYPSLNPLRLTIFRLRPRLNISAEILTHSLNTIFLKDFNQVRPGDLLKVGEGHVALVSEVEIDNKKKVKRIGYLHSTSDYLEQHGVREGNIFTNKQEKPLESQKWDEQYRGQNWMLEDYLAAPPAKRGFRRLKILS